VRRVDHYLPVKYLFDLKMLTRTSLVVAVPSFISTKTTCKFQTSGSNERGLNWVCSYRSVRNFVIDLTAMPATTSATGLHWQVSQATSLYNVVVNMSTASNTAHQGLF
jgi:hypothetical protein